MPPEMDVRDPAAVKLDRIDETVLGSACGFTEVVELYVSDLSGPAMEPVVQAPLLVKNQLHPVTNLES